MNAKTETAVQAPAVYSAIASVMGDLAKQGIGKNQTNTYDKYKFRGIDDVYNALAPMLARHGLLILPRVLERTSEERTSQKGGAVFYITVAVEFDFVAAADGSVHTIRAYGEAMDRGDKGTNKAMTAAYKYACFEAFCIPTAGSDDADAETHEVESRAPANAHGTGPGQPLNGAWDGLDEAQRNIIFTAADVVNEYMESGDASGAHEHIESCAFAAEEKLALWSILPSKTRTALKKVKQEIAA
jgi:hypothetical protein